MVLLNPEHQASLQNALALHNAMRLEAAAAVYRTLLSAHPDHADVLQLLGALEYQRGDAVAAVALMERSLAIDPHQPIVQTNVANALSMLGRGEEAIARYDKAIAQAPDFADAHYNRGCVLSALRRPAEALESFELAVRHKPDYPDAWLNRGNALKDLRRYDDAVASYRRTVALVPQRADAFNNIGTAYEALGRADEALENYRHASVLDSTYAAAFHNMGVLLHRLRREAEAGACYARALRLDPDLPFLRGAYLHVKQHLCDWSAREADLSAVLAEVEAGHACAAPFDLFATPASAAQLHAVAKSYTAALYPPAPAVWRGEAYNHDKIRVGYFSADFHSHATAHLITGLIEAHDRSRFDLFGLSWGAFETSALRTRLEGAFNGIIDIQYRSDDEAAELARKFEIDIAVDLKGFTQNARPGIFARRMAPVQVGYLGFPGTMGADYIDYLIADPVLVPPAHRPHYSEHIVYLPDSYQANDAKRPRVTPRFTRTELGLPEGGFVFCSFNNLFKITPEIFHTWMALLREVRDSVLWLLEGDRAACENLKRAAEERGISARRLVFAPRMGGTDHLDRHLLADLCLDTIHCNGHTTTSDALWAGVPVVACLGDTFASRVSASLLTAVGLPELITPDLAAYTTVARDLARAPSRLTALRGRLAVNRVTFPLFNTARFARHLEAAYTEMWRRAQKGLPPDVIHVAALSNNE
jgi:predicted O-linked N-acetylglucosamine transferase (SPINDLY family)